MLLGAKVGQAPEAVLLPLWSFISSTSSLARVLGRLVEAQGPTAAQPCGKGCWWYTDGWEAACKIISAASVHVGMCYGGGFKCVWTPDRTNQMLELGALGLRGSLEVI